MKKHICECGNEHEIEIIECEKCGGEMGEKLIGDELYAKCPDCGHMTPNY